MNKLKWVLLVLIFLLLIVIVIIFTRLNIVLDYKHSEDNDRLTIQFKAFFGLIKYRIDTPLIKIDDNSPTLVTKKKTKKGPTDKLTNENVSQFSAEDLLSSLHDTREIINHVVKLHRIIRLFLIKVKVTKFEWQSVVGVGDAAYTGIITGAFWAIKGSLLCIISKYLNVITEPYIMITPNFQKAVSQTSVKCMIHFRIGYAILAGIKLLKYWKGGKPHFKSKPLSTLNNSEEKTV
ncbi:DUF2953 domain-containing protein [Bacillus aquiflavi]|uniref:DUF2953 domain-containing protein n=1 Tax=Bacillus aquiflavi TaxID=2672567 RepID=UPI0028681B8E|nr:DUF2953 domain-containing protein [Bacillus aquiflavi]